ncbi:MAG: PIG-L family deacetylase [Clostridia bacterium]|nr:PIG-L family deacetylase [Clostridia bacterium]
MKKWMGILALCVLIMYAAISQAEKAKEITADCTLTGSQKKTIDHMRDGRYFTNWLANKGGALTIAAPQGEVISGVYVQFYEVGYAFDVETRNDAGEWTQAAACDTDFLTGYAVLNTPVQEIRIRAKDERARMSIAEVHVFAEGEMPGWVQRWQPPCEDADLLVISAHPDDEILFMGGTIPYYAGERKMDVQVAYLVPSMPYRELELLDGLWLCGVRHYPDLGPFPDRFKLYVRDMYKEKGWNESRVLRYVTGLYRRYMPEVVVTHDVNGEYGHGAHKVAADAAQRCIALAADAAWQDEQLAYKQPWQVKKLYLHLYELGQLRMDWRVPLDAFDGKTAFDMAEAAFQCHTSQLKTGYCVEDFGPYDNAVFGLTFSAVGEDQDKNDFFEHIQP